jgi:hypothetical protein
VADPPGGRACSRYCPDLNCIPPRCLWSGISLDGHRLPVAAHFGIRESWRQEARGVRAAQLSRGERASRAMSQNRGIGLRPTSDTLPPNGFRLLARLQRMEAAFLKLGLQNS